GRYPGADTISAYWENLKAGKDCIGEIPGNRWAVEGFYCPDKQEAISKLQSYSNLGGFLDNIDHFAYEFFGMSPIEATVAGPKELLFLETAWNLLETSGYTKDTLC